MGKDISPATRRERAWLKMRAKGILERCERECNGSYHNYGGKGITIDPEFYGNFVDIARDLPGYRQFADIVLHRIDSTEGYTPENCVWMDRKAHRAMHSKERAKCPDFRSKFFESHWVKIQFDGKEYPSIKAWWRANCVAFGYLHVAKEYRRGVPLEEILARDKSYAKRKVSDILYQGRSYNSLIDWWEDNCEAVNFTWVQAMTGSGMSLERVCDADREASLSGFDW